MGIGDVTGHLVEDSADFDELYPSLARLKKKEPRLIRHYEEAFATAREFRHKVAEQRALDIDRKAMEDPTYVDAETLRLACEYRLFSMGFPRMLGGQGSPFGAISVACEAISAGCAGIANLVYVNGLAISCVAATMNLRWIAEFAEIVCGSEKTGRPRLLSTAITEPGAGSDVEDDELVRDADLCCSARPVQGGYLLNGRKVFISNGSVADTHVVLMATDPKRPAETSHSFRVRTGTPGFSIGRVERKMGQKACQAAELIFEDCFVPEEDRMASESVYLRGIDFVLAGTRGGVGAFGAGVARGAFERALHYCKTHDLRGTRMIEHQWVQFKLTRMLRNATMARTSFVEAIMANEQFGLIGIMNQPIINIMDSIVPTRLSTSPRFQKALQSGRSTALIQKAADSLTRRMMGIASRQGDAAKILGTDMGIENCYLAIDLMGGDGIRHDRGMEKCYRDAKLLQIYEGTNQINARDIYKCTLGRPASA